MSNSLLIQAGPHKKFIPIPEEEGQILVLKTDATSSTGLSFGEETGGVTQEYVDDAISGLAGGHDPITLTGLTYISKDANQQLTLNAINLTTDVTGQLPRTNLDPATQTSLASADSAVQPIEINTLAGLNAIVGDATLVDQTYVDTAAGNATGTTNLSYIPSPTDGTVASDTGTDVILPLADGINAGLMAPSDFTKLGAISGTNTGDQDLTDYVTNPTTAADNQVAVFTADGVVEGTANFTYDGSILDIKNGGTASSIKLYCEVGNAHFTELKSAPHANYTGGSKTFVLPAVDGSSGHVLQTDGAGNLSFVAPSGGSGNVATDTIWDAAGDLAVGSAADTAARLAIGTEGQVLTVSGGAVTWGAATLDGLADTTITNAATGSATTGGTWSPDISGLTFTQSGEYGLAPYYVAADAFGAGQDATLSNYTGFWIISSGGPGGFFDTYVAQGPTHPTDPTGSYSINSGFTSTGTVDSFTPGVATNLVDGYVLTWNDTGNTWEPAASAAGGGGTVQGTDSTYQIEATLANNDETPDANGTYSVNLQTKTSLATQVASGDYSTIGGGRNNTASGFNSSVGGGLQNRALGTYSTVAGGDQNTASGNYNFFLIGDGWSTVSGGYFNTASTGSTVGGGYQNTASGDYLSTVGGGYGNTASGYYSTVSGGKEAKADKYGQQAYSAGIFAVQGDAQTSLMVVRNETTTANQTELFLNQFTERMTIADDTTWFFEINLVARRTDGNDESAIYKFEGAIDRNSGAATTLLVGIVAKTVYAEDTPAWDATVEADNTNGALVIKVTGETAKTIRWVARVETTEVTG